MIAMAILTLTTGPRAVPKKPEVFDVREARYLRDETRIATDSIMQVKHLFGHC